MDRLSKGGMAATLVATVVAFLAISPQRAFAGEDVASRAYANIPIVAPPPPHPPEARSFYTLFAAIKLRDWDKAYKLADESGNPLARKIVSWVRFTASGERTTFEEVTAFIAANPKWPSQRVLEANAEDSLTKDPPTDDVIAWFDKHPPVSPKGAMYYAKALIAKGRKAEARKLVRKTWVGMNFQAALERTFYRWYHGMLTPEDHIKRLDRLLWDGRGWEARRMLRRVSKGYAALAVARIRLRAHRGGVDWAIRQVPDKLVSDPGLIYERLRWRRRKGRDDEAIEMLKELPKNPPRPDLIWQEQEILARRALDDGNITEAYRLAAHHPKLEGVDFAEAEWLAGFISLRFLNEPKTALPHFSRLYENVNFPVSLARGAYWAGRSAEAMGQTQAAIVWYRRAARHITTFYGQLAAMRLDKTAEGGPDTRKVPPAPTITPAIAAAFADREIVKATKLMAFSQEANQFRIFVRHLVDLAKTPAEHVLAARIAVTAGRHDVAVSAAKDSLKDGVQLLKAGWPVTRLPKNRHGLEDGILLALMRQESGFNADAVSWAGARGLMQVMPATARRMSRKLGLKFSRERLLNDAEYNLTIGSAYFAHVLDDFQGSYVLALAAYNAGPARVRRWLKRHGDFRTGEVDGVDWIELIPFEETRNYVERVIENVQVYRSLAGPGPMRIEALRTIGRTLPSRADAAN